MNVSEPEIWNDADDYADVSIYITTGKKEEWKFNLYLEKETGQIFDSCTQYAPTLEDCFDQATVEPPIEVYEAFLASRQKAVTLLKGLK